MRMGSTGPLWPSRAGAQGGWEWTGGRGLAAGWSCRVTARGPRAGPPHTGLGCSSWRRQVSRPCAPSGTRRWRAGEGLGPLPPPLPHTDRPPLPSVPRKARRRPGLGAAAPSSPPPAGRAWAAPSPARPPPLPPSRPLPPRHFRPPRPSSRSQVRGLPAAPLAHAALPPASTCPLVTPAGGTACQGLAPGGERGARSVPTFPATRDPPAFLW